MQERRDQFSPQELAAVREILKRLNRDPGTVTFALALISRQFNIWDLPAVETELRGMKSDTFLVARDIKEKPEFDARVLVGNLETRPYYVWVNMAGFESAKTMYRAVGSSERENMERLREAGLLVPKLTQPQLDRMRTSPGPVIVLPQSIFPNRRN